VTSRSDSGKSHVFIDAQPRTFGTLHEIWATERGIPAAADAVDPDIRPLKISPSNDGTIFRLVVIEPEKTFAHMSEAQRREDVRRSFSRVASENALVDTSRHPAMHQTKTIDYIVVLSGSVTMLLDEGEVQLEPFDVVVQRGTNHAWVNRSEQPVLLAAVLTGTPQFDGINGVDA
jgi:mannose-6-phosphate isomerase-like protein (cupin superfamily)